MGYRLSAAYIGYVCGDRRGHLPVGAAAEGDRCGRGAARGEAAALCARRPAAASWQADAGDAQGGLSGLRAAAQPRAAVAMSRSLVSVPMSGWAPSLSGLWLPPSPDAPGIGDASTAAAEGVAELRVGSVGEKASALGADPAAAAPAAAGSPAREAPWQLRLAALRARLPAAAEETRPCGAAVACAEGVVDPVGSQGPLSSRSQAADARRTAAGAGSVRGADGTGGEPDAAAAAASPAAEAMLRRRCAACASSAAGCAPRSAPSARARCASSKRPAAASALARRSKNSAVVALGSPRSADMGVVGSARASTLSDGSAAAAGWGSEVRPEGEGCGSRRRRAGGGRWSREPRLGQAQACAGCGGRAAPRRACAACCQAWLRGGRGPFGQALWHTGATPPALGRRHSCDGRASLVSSMLFLAPPGAVMEGSALWGCRYILHPCCRVQKCTW